MANVDQRISAWFQYDQVRQRHLGIVILPIEVLADTRQNPQDARQFRWVVSRYDDS